MMKTGPDLTIGPVQKHLLKLTIPAASGMAFDTLYNLTDNWYAGMISDQALIGLSMASIVFLLLIALTIGLQSGTSAVIAPNVSQGHRKKIQRWFSNAIGLSLFMSVVIIFIGIVFSKDLLTFIVSENSALEEAWHYLSIIILGNVFYGLSSVCAGVLIAMGNTTTYRNILIIGFFLNLALNPLLTFQLNMGISGLALATLIIKLISVTYLFYVLHKQFGYSILPSIKWHWWRLLLKQVVPSSLNFFTIIIGGFIIIIFIGHFGEEAIAGYSVALRIEQLLLLPALGLSTAVMAIVGQNHGLQKHQRIKQTFLTALKLGAYISLLFIPIMLWLSPFLMNFFTSNINIISIGVLYLKIDAIAFFGYVAIFICVALLQAIKKPNFPMYVGIGRQLVLPVLINYFLIVLWKNPIETLFYSIVFIVLISALTLFWYTKKQINQL